MLVVSVLLTGPLDDVVVGGRSIRDLAADALVGIPVVAWDAVPTDTCLVVHDPAVTNVPPVFVAELVERCLDSGRPQLAVGAVTDTVKEMRGGSVGATVDRDGLATVLSPIVLPPGVRPAARRTLDIVDEVRAHHGWELVEAPARVARLSDLADAEVLAAAVGH